MAVVLNSRRDITLPVAGQVGWGDQAVMITPAALARMADARAAFERLIANPDITIYGIMVLARLANFLDGHAAMRPERAQTVAHRSGDPTERSSHSAR